MIHDEYDMTAPRSDIPTEAPLVQFGFRTSVRARTGPLGLSYVGTWAAASRGSPLGFGVGV